MTTINLLRTIGYPGESGGPPLLVEKSLYRTARKNKIGSLYVNSLKHEDVLDGLEDAWQNRKDFQERLTRTACRLADTIPQRFKYAVVKSNHDFWADHSDIDIVLFDGDLAPLRSRLLNSGYKYVGDSPTSFDVLDPETDIEIDVQAAFSLQNVIYFDKKTVRDRVHEQDVLSTRMPVLSKPDDLALLVVHSMTEQLFLLKEFYAALYALESFSKSEITRFFDTVEKNSIQPACKAFFTLVEEISTNTFDCTPPYLKDILIRYPPYEFEREALVSSGSTTPHRYTTQSGLRTLAKKSTDWTFLRSVASQIPHLAHPSMTIHIGRQLFTRRQRDHYVYDTSDTEL